MRLDGRFIGGLDAASENAFWKAVIEKAKKEAGVTNYDELARHLYSRQQLANEQVRRSDRLLSSSYKDKTGVHVVQFTYNDFEDMCNRRGNFLRHLIYGGAYSYLTDVDKHDVSNVSQTDDIYVNNVVSNIKSDIAKDIDSIIGEDVVSSVKEEVAKNIADILDEDLDGSNESMANEESFPADEAIRSRDNVTSINKNMIEYEGVLGKFRYNSKLFTLMKSDKLNYEFLHYDGKETDGSKIKIPEGCTNCNRMFYDRKDLKSATVIGDEITNCDKMFYGCKRSVVEQGKWQIEHRNQVYDKEQVSTPESSDDMEL